MKDVAARAGVGLSTVSRVVAGTGGVSPAKARAVERAIRDLGFIRNESARTLRTGTATTIGVVVRAISDPFFARLISAIEAEAQARDLLVLVANGTDDPEHTLRLLHRLLRRRLDGLILAPPDGADLAFLDRERRAGLPVVLVDSPAPGLDADRVTVDNAGATAAGVRHLAAAGHRRIACLAHRAGVYTSEQRRLGFAEGLRSAGLAPAPELVAVVEDDIGDCARAMERFLAESEPPTAVITTNGRITRTALAAFHRVGFEGALVAFDDFDFAPLLTPPTTTIVQDPATLGRLATGLLFDRMDGDTGPARAIQLGTNLIARGSGERRPLALGHDMDTMGS